MILRNGIVTENYVYSLFNSIFSNVGQNGKYWMVRDGGIFADSDLPQGFYLELREPTRYIHTGSVSFSSG